MVNSFRKVIDVGPQNHGSLVKPLSEPNDQLKNTQNPIGNVDYCCNRVFHTVLFNQVKEYTVDSFVGSIFPSEISSEEVKKALEKDRRLELEEVESGIIRVKISKTAAADNEKLLRNVEAWKNEMSKYFRKYNCDVKLCMLPQLIKRPAAVPKDVKLVDILNSDPQRRFLLINSSMNANKRSNEETMVKYKHTPDEVEYFHKEWRNHIVEYLLREPHPIPLVTVGTQVAKPKNLGKNQKLIEVVKADPSRFRIIPDLSHNSLTRICLTDEFCKNLWRERICKVFSDRRPSCEQEILHRVPRPIPLSNRVMPSDLFPQHFWDFPSQHRVMHEEPMRQFVGRHHMPLHKLPQTAIVSPLTCDAPPGFNGPLTLKRQISEETQTVLRVVDFLFDE